MHQVDSGVDIGDIDAEAVGRVHSCLSRLSAIGNASVEPHSAAIHDGEVRVV